MTTINVIAPFKEIMEVVKKRDKNLGIVDKIRVSHLKVPTLEYYSSQNSTHTF